jgi:hypothetical protein
MVITGCHRALLIGEFDRTTEHGIEHRFREALGERILLTDVVAADNGE